MFIRGKKIINLFQKVLSVPLLFIATCFGIVILLFSNSCSSLAGKASKQIAYNPHKKYWVEQRLSKKQIQSEQPIRDEQKKLIRLSSEISNGKISSEESEYFKRKKQGIQSNLHQYELRFKEKKNYFDNGVFFTRNSKASAKYFEGIEHLRNKFYSQAVQKFESALALNPKLKFFSDTSFWLGYGYLHLAGISNQSADPMIKAEKYFRQFLNYSERNVSDSFYKISQTANDDYQQKVDFAKYFLNLATDLSVSSHVMEDNFLWDTSFSLSSDYRHYFYNHFLIYGYNYDNRLGKSLTLPYYYHDQVGHHAGLMNILNWHPKIDTIVLLQFIGIDYQIFLTLPIQIFTTPKENFSFQVAPKSYIAYQVLSGYDQNAFYYNFGMGVALGYYLQQNIFVGFESDIFYYHYQNQQTRSLSVRDNQNSTASPTFSQWADSFVDMKGIYFLTRTIGLQSSFYYDFFLPQDNIRKKGWKFALYYDPFSLDLSYDILQKQFSINFVTFYSYQTVVRR